MQRSTLKFKSTERLYIFLNFNVDHVICIYMCTYVSGNFSDLGN